MPYFRAEPKNLLSNKDLKRNFSVLRLRCHLFLNGKDAKLAKRQKVAAVHEF